MILSKLRFIDLFCGIGGFHVALAKHGNLCVFACDIDRLARRAYCSNFGIEPAGDITKIKESDVPNCDILCAGFPCQPFSIMGKQLGRFDKRADVFDDIIRIANAKKPMLCLLENVPFILTADNGYWLNKMHHDFAKAGYCLHYYKLNSAHFGVPQARKRIYFVAIRNDVNLTTNKPLPTFQLTPVGNIIDQDTEHKTACEPYVLYKKKPEQQSLQGTFDLQKFKARAIGNIVPVKNKLRKVDHCIVGSDAPYSTVLCSNNKWVLFNSKVIQLNTDELKQVMGFDKQHYAPRVRLIGNAVIPAMVDAVYANISN